MDRQRNLIVFIPSYPWVLECLIHIISLFILFFGDLFYKILSKGVVQRREGAGLEFILEIFCLHAGVVEGMGSLVEHHEHDYCA